MRTTQTTLLTDFLNIPDVKVTHFIQDPSLGIILSVASLTSEVACPHCGQMSHKLHHNYSHLIKYLPMVETISRFISKKSRNNPSLVSGDNSRF